MNKKNISFVEQPSLFPPETFVDPLFYKQILEEATNLPLSDEEDF